MYDSTPSNKQIVARRPGRLEPKVNTGCLNCKNRKRKCDGTKPTCFRCVQFRLICSGYPPFTTQLHNPHNFDSFPFAWCAFSDIIDATLCSSLTSVAREQQPGPYARLSPSNIARIKVNTAYTRYQLSPAITLEQARIFSFQCPTTFSMCATQLTFKLPSGHYTVTGIHVAAFITWKIHLVISQSAERPLTYVVDHRVTDTRLRAFIGRHMLKHFLCQLPNVSQPRRRPSMGALSALSLLVGNTGLVLQGEFGTPRKRVHDDSTIYRGRNATQGSELHIKRPLPMLTLLMDSNEAIKLRLDTGQSIPLVSKRLHSTKASVVKTNLVDHSTQRNWSGSLRSLMPEDRRRWIVQDLNRSRLDREFRDTRTRSTDTNDALDKPWLRQFKARRLRDGQIRWTVDVRRNLFTLRSSTGMLPENTTRLTWTCTCGHQAFDDFQELTERAVDDFATAMICAGYISHARISNCAEGQISRLAMKANNAFVGARRRLSRLRSTTLPTFSIPRSTTSIALQCLPTRKCRWLHMCFKKRPYATKLEPLHVCQDEQKNEYTDATFFQALRKAYYAHRTWKEKLLFKLKRIEFVEVGIPFKSQ